MAKLGRKEVSSRPPAYYVAKGLNFQRAAERYADVTPEEWERRKQRGWGDGIADDVCTACLAFCHVINPPNWHRLNRETVPRHQALPLLLLSRHSH